MAGNLLLEIIIQMRWKREINLDDREFQETIRGSMDSTEQEFHTRESILTHW